MITSSLLSTFFFINDNSNNSNNSISFVRQRRQYHRYQSKSKRKRKNLIFQKMILQVVILLMTVTLSYCSSICNQPNDDDNEEEEEGNSKSFDQQISCLGNICETSIKLRTTHPYVVLTSIMCPKGLRCGAGFKCGAAFGSGVYYEDNDLTKPTLSVISVFILNVIPRTFMLFLLLASLKLQIKGWKKPQESVAHKKYYAHILGTITIHLLLISMLYLTIHNNILFYMDREVLFTTANFHSRGALLKQSGTYFSYSLGLAVVILVYFISTWQRLVHITYLSVKVTVFLQ